MDDSYPQDLVRHVAGAPGWTRRPRRGSWRTSRRTSAETVEEYVAQAPPGAQDRNRKNDDIWPLIAAELKTRRFGATELSERQLRRMVYG